MKLEMNGFTPISSPPDDERTVLLCHPEWPDEPVWPGYIDSGEWKFAEGHPCIPEPLGWMEFPEPIGKEAA